MNGIVGLEVPEETREKLDRMGRLTSQPMSSHAARAIREYVEHELAIIEGIREGLEDARAGRVVPHNEAMEEIERVIARHRK